MTEATIPNLSPNERGMQLDTGEYVAVSLTTTTDVNPLFATVAVRARMVDNTTGATVLVGDSPVQGAPHSLTVPMQQVSDDINMLFTLVATQIQTEAQRMRGYKTALQAVRSFLPPAQ